MRDWRARGGDGNEGEQEMSRPARGLKAGVRAPAAGGLTLRLRPKDNAPPSWQAA